MSIRKSRWLFLWLAAAFAAGCGGAHDADVRVASSDDDTEAATDPHAGLDGFRLSSTSEQAVDSDNPVVALGRVRLTAPEGWTRKAPRSDFIQAEFALPRAEGDGVDGRLTVSTAGGSIEDNIDRWRKQFSQQLDGDRQEVLPVGDVDVTLVDFWGTYNDQRGPFAPPNEAPNYRMLGAIFSVDEALHFVKLYGPEKTIAARAEEFRGFLQSLKVESPSE